MGYYPIKCIRCAHVTDNENVLFDTTKVTQDMQSMLRGHDDERADAGEDKQKAAGGSAGLWDDEDDEDGEAAGGAEGSAAHVELRKLMTASQLEQYCEANGLARVERRYQPHIRVTPDFQDELTAQSTESVLIGLCFQKEPGGAMLTTRSRYCPECHQELPKQSGAMPTYNVTVMGTSASGKTVYLCALNRILSQHQGKLPYWGTLSCVPSGTTQNELASLSNALFDQGVLPASTQVLFTEPLVFLMTFTMKGQGKVYEKKCLLALTDMRGEDMVGESGEHLLVKSRYYANADGFMVLVSPQNIASIIGRVEHEEGAEVDITVHRKLAQHINDFILPNFQDSKIDAPCVVMLSKCDFLINNCKQIGIPAFNPVIAGEPRIKFSGTYFKLQNDGTQQILQKKDPSLYGFLRTAFEDLYFTSFSSLGTKAQIGVDKSGLKVVKSRFALQPLRVENSVVYLLMRLGFLPQFAQMEQGKANDARNLQLLAQWFEECT